MNKKIILASTVLVGTVATPIALTLSSSVSAYETNPYVVTIATGAPFKTLNKFKVATTADSDLVLGTFTSALLKDRPQGKRNGGLETALSIPKLSFDFQAFSDEKLKAAMDPDSPEHASAIATALGGFGKSSFGYSSLTGDLAKEVAPLGTANRTVGVAFNLREEARFWNGDRVTAEDFINTIKIALDARNGVPWAWQIYKTMGIKNADKIWNAQVANNMTLEDALKIYPLGVIPAGDVIPEDKLATSIEGKAFFRNEYANNRKRHSKLVYLFEGDLGMTFLSTYALNTISSPTNIRHFNKVGIDDWGTSIDNLMGCGPYKLKYFDLDYKIVTNRWEGYWDRARVISPQIQMRVLPDVSSQIQMFKDGKVGTVSFGASLLPQFFGDPELKKYVNPTNWAEKLTYLALNTRLDRPNAKWLLKNDMRKAIQHSINRSGYLKMVGADNSYPTESWTTLSYMNDGVGKGPINYAMNFSNEIGFLNHSTYGQNQKDDNTWNKIYALNSDDPINLPSQNSEVLFTRDEGLLTSTDQTKNNKTDHIFNPTRARAYYERFKKNNPSYNGMELDFLVPGTSKEQVVIIKQDIERILPGVKVKILPKPQLVYSQVISGLNWDMAFNRWSYDFRDPWTFYHLVGDKISQSNADDIVVGSRITRNISSDGLSLVDWIADKYTKDPGYFAKRYLNSTNQTDIDEMNKVIAQFLRMEATVGSDNPSLDEFKSPIDAEKKITSYDSSIWNVEPSEKNDFNGYKGQFDKYKDIFPQSNQWSSNLQKIIQDGDNSDLWKNKTYRFRVLYPVIEKMIRDSAIGLSLSRIQNSYIASRFIGESNYADQIKYLGYVYQANNIPQSSFVLPGKEAITV